MSEKPTFLSKDTYFPRKEGREERARGIYTAGRPQSLTNYPSNIVASQILTPRGSNTCGCCCCRWSLAPSPSSSIHPLLEIMMGIDRIEGRKGQFPAGSGREDDDVRILARSAMKRNYKWSRRGRNKK